VKLADIADDVMIDPLRKKEVTAMTEIGDVIELVVDLPSHNLLAGAQGTIVHRHSEDAFDVEFADDSGETREWLALRVDQFIVVWRAETRTWVPLAERTANLVATLPEDAAREVLDFARFLRIRQPANPMTA